MQLLLSSSPSFFAPHRHTTAAEMQSRHTPRRSNNNLPLPCLVHTTFLSGLTSIITQLLHHKKKMTELKRTKKRCWARGKWASPLPHLVPSCVVFDSSTFFHYLWFFVVYTRGSTSTWPSLWISDTCLVEKYYVFRVEDYHLIVYAK